MKRISRKAREKRDYCVAQGLEYIGPLWIKWDSELRQASIQEFEILYKYAMTLAEKKSAAV